MTSLPIRLKREMSRRLYRLNVIVISADSCSVHRPGFDDDSCYHHRDGRLLLLLDLEAWYEWHGGQLHPKYSDGNAGLGI
jgi:hypothetical protein